LSKLIPRDSISLPSRHSLGLYLCSTLIAPLCLSPSLPLPTAHVVPGLCAIISCGSDPRQTTWESVGNSTQHSTPPHAPDANEVRRIGRYGVVLDAGSSVSHFTSRAGPLQVCCLRARKGTRVHIYRWLNNHKAKKKASTAQLHSLPVIETDKKWTKKIHPGMWECYDAESRKQG
jgi:hypothetical protein